MTAGPIALAVAVAAAAMLGFAPAACANRDLPASR